MNLELKPNINNVFDDVEIIVDPELEDESTVDINDYLNKHILQCRICGNMFPSTIILDNETECPICDSKSAEGFIYKGRLLKKNDNKDEKEETTSKESAIDDLNDPMDEISTEEEVDNYIETDSPNNDENIE